MRTRYASIAIATLVIAAAVATGVSALRPDGEPPPATVATPPAPTPRATPAVTTATPAATPARTPTPTPLAAPAVAPPPAPTPTATPVPPPTATPVPAAVPAPTPATSQTRGPSGPPPALLRFSPAFEAPPGVYTAIAVGWDYACALAESGAAVCWNIETGEQSDTPAGRYTFITIAGRDETACATTEAGEIVCWGVWVGDLRPHAVNLPPGRYSALNLQGDPNCALTDVGEAICESEGRPGRWPKSPSGPFVAISIGWSYDTLDEQMETATHVCAVTGTGKSVCWGYRNHHIDGFTEDAYYVEDAGEYVAIGFTAYGDRCGLTTNGRSTCLKRQPDPQIRYTAVSTSGWHHCAITEAGKAICEWESDFRAGELRVMSPPDPTPESYVTISVADGVRQPHTYACALTETGRAVCWRSFQNKVERPDPAPGPYVAVSDGSGHTCALAADGRVDCWGWNNFGQLEVPQGHYTAISADSLSTCAITDAREAVCWGELREAPAGTHIAIATLGGSACALTEAGEPVCWGRPRSIPEGLLAETPDGSFVRISVGGFFDIVACVLTAAGEATCWGDDAHGQTDVPPGRYQAISAGAACALTELGEIVCWRGASRTYGTAPTETYVTMDEGAADRVCAIDDEGWPVCLGVPEDYGPPPDRYTAVSSSDRRACALNESGAVVCWGITPYEGSAPTRY